MSEYRKQIDSSDELGRWYDAKYTEMGDGWNTPADECNRHLDDLGVVIDKTKTLLDIGCGAGHFLVEAHKRTTAYGVEISKVGVELCLKRGVNAKQINIGSRLPEWFDAKFDYVVSLGSLEHIVDLDSALDNIRDLLKPTGKFYFYCPNELWKHFDQPNERTMTDEEWIALFALHGLYVESKKRWNDNTAFIGSSSAPILDQLNAATFAHMGWPAPPIRVIELPPQGNKLNIGSGQRRFDTAYGWINVDCASRPPDQVPDLVCDVGTERLPYADNSIDFVILHHVYEHFGPADGHKVIREANRVLRASGSLILTLPDWRALAQRWLTGQISDYIYFINVYGAYQGLEGDRHKWGYTAQGLKEDLTAAMRDDMRWTKIVPFNWRTIPGADIARDWWIAGMEAVK